MDQPTIETLFVIGVVSVLSVLIAHYLRRFYVSAVVLEILAGILVGPQALGIGHLTPVIVGLGSAGLTFLMFMAGYEIDFDRVKGVPLRLAGMGWAFSLAVGLLFGGLLEASGHVLSGLVTGLALTKTALGTMLPMWRDAGLLGTRLGSHALAIGSVGEFGPIVAVALLLTSDNPLKVSLVLLAFVIVAIGASLLAMRPRRPATVRLLQRHLHSSGQLPVRIALLIVIGLVFLARSFNLDVLLGAFAAGIVAHLFLGGTVDAPLVKEKLEAISFGFFVPIFFVESGMAFDLHSLVDQPRRLLDVPLFLGMFLVVRGLPVFLFYRRAVPATERPALALFSATALPLVVAITDIGVTTHEMRPSVAAALVAAAILSVLFFPPTAFARLRTLLAAAKLAPQES